MSLCRIECKQCGYLFGQADMDFNEELPQHVINDHDGFCEISVGIIE